MFEIVVNVLGIVISAFLFVFSRGFAASSRPGIPSAAFFPTIISVILLFLGILNLVKYFIAKKNGEVEEEAKMSHVKLLQFFALLAILLLYATLWDFKIGHFILNSIICFSPICWLLSDETEWWKSVLFVTGLTIFIYLLFVTGLKVRIW